MEVDKTEAARLLHLARFFPIKLTPKEFRILKSILPPGEEKAMEAKLAEQKAKAAKKKAGPKRGGSLILTSVEVNKLRDAGYTTDKIKKIAELAKKGPTEGDIRFINPKDFEKGTDEWKVITALGFVDIDEDGNMSKVFLPVLFAESNVALRGNYYHKDRGWY
ncbi:MAG: hypothetical protein ABH950_10240 [Candidatus Altiarchaeota archaeon]